MELTKLIEGRVAVFCLARRPRVAEALAEAQALA